MSGESRKSLRRRGSNPQPVFPRIEACMDDYSMPTLRRGAGEPALALGEMCRRAGDHVITA